ncbi:MAG: sulfate adenylyltransferase subunit CysN [Candidatus Pacebacteria bacterium]|nr:sulfate adenylyltransferase subunit CysN [Candidatus Paceibacterota bacterium]
MDGTVNRAADHDVQNWLESEVAKSMLRFITCGSVDDGKSSLLGRMLFDSKMIFSDQLESLAGDSRKFGTRNEQIDFALLVDGLAAEREQGITIDVAWRFFSTPKRKFIVADTPGHEQYTRNMVTAASTAELAVILIDARKGVLTQTRRHSQIVQLLGVREVVLAVNKMDLMDYSQAVFDQIVADYRAFAQSIGIGSITAIPLVAITGEMILDRGENLNWYRGRTLLDHLETVEIAEAARTGGESLRFPVQWVNRPHLDFRGYAGTVAAGRLRVGDRLRALPSNKESTVAKIVTFDGELDKASRGQAVTLTLNDEIDISRGDLLCHTDLPAMVGQQFLATLIWMDETALVPRRSYLLKIGTTTVPATVEPPNYRINPDRAEHLATETLGLNDIGVAVVSTDRAIAFDPYLDSASGAINRVSGGFILIDRTTNATVAAGLINQPVELTQNLSWQDLDIDRAARAALMQQEPMVLWLTGLSGSGKSTIANQLEARLHLQGRHTFILDGDNVRHGLNHDLGFSETDRIENIRRVAHVARLMIDAGLIVIVSFISPFRAEREMAKQVIGPDQFREVYIDTPLAVAESRDPKGLYARARKGEIANFTGISSPYEPPITPDLRIDTTLLSVEDSVQEILTLLGRDVGVGI